MRLIAGRYRLLEQLGGDALWRAEDTELEREVAVRLLSPDEPASLVVQLSHPNIVRVFDQGESDGERFEVHEYVAGEPLARRLEQGTLSEREARRVEQEVAAALAYAHSLGIAHGSLGPESVLIDVDGHAKVTGFGGGDAEDDERALAALVAAMSTATPSEPATAILRPLSLPGRSYRRQAIPAAAAALALAAAGVGAALLAASAGGDGPSTSAPVDPISSVTGETAPPSEPSPATTSEQTTTTAPATTQAPTTAPGTTATLPLPTTPVPTTVPPPTTEPLPTEPPPPATTEEPPPPTTVALP